ncbi:FecR family protein [Sphingobium chlorophenolicum]|uniref:Fe2+-dicitrate sensor, membrane component n=2 Tax=Sphingobium chlorophenolicum TaxID=46429 RepID=A0A081RDX3_SPHCR|nr:FecR domain-containing protein [Sphingobium chlorophenolicum]KEQ53396.1 Fe2+-dicitrate sensor, membrane component [Sphingobium chlorophenolicum]
MSPSEGAAHWLVIHDSRPLNPGEEAEFAAWIADSGNAEAWRSANNAMAVFDFDSGHDANLRALRQAALEAQPVPKVRPAFVLGALAASVLALIAVGTAMHQVATEGGRKGAETRIAASAPDSGAQSTPGSLEYSTRAGERRTIRLADGTSVTLNTRSRLIVAFTEKRRVVRLASGQALFEVAHDRNRPFAVIAADRQITALGTVFEVRVDPGRVNVVLFQGRVVVDRVPDAAAGSAAVPLAPTILQPGQGFSAELGTPQKVGAVDVERQLLWRDGFVEFDDEPLGRAVAEINRYSSHPITLNDDGVAALHVSGVYRTGAPGQFIDAIQGILPVEAHPTTDGNVELSLGKHP